MSDKLIELQKQFYNTQLPIQTVPSVYVDYDTFSVKNAFNVQLVNSIIEPCLRTNKIPMFVFNDAANKVGIVSERLHKKQIAAYGVPTNEVYNANADSAVVNILQYPGWFSQEKALMTEIAEVEWAKQGFSDKYKATTTTDKGLFTEYLLDSAICYVEIFRDGAVDKFLATRNVNLLYHLSVATKDADGKEPYMKLNKDLAPLANRTAYCKYLALTRTQIESGTVSYIKLGVPTKRTKTYNIVMPRGMTAQLRADMQYRITPAYLLVRQNKWFNNLLRNNVVSFTYVKDKLQLRDITTTLNKTTLTELMGNDSARADAYIKSFNESTFLSGSYRVPDIALLNDSNALRVMNLRICKVHVQNLNTFVNPYSEYDVTEVANVFKSYLRANSENVNAMQQYTLFMTMLMRKAWFDQATAEYQHYYNCMQTSQYTMAHKQMVAYIATEIQEKQKTIKQSTLVNIQGKTASELYVALLANINNAVAQGTIEFCKQLDEEMRKHNDLFPDYANVLKVMCQNNVVSTTL